MNDEFKAHAATLVNNEESNDDEGDESGAKIDDQEENHDQGPLSKSKPSSHAKETTAPVTHLGKLTTKLYISFTHYVALQHYECMEFVVSNCRNTVVLRRASHGGIITTSWCFLVLGRAS